MKRLAVACSIVVVLLGAVCCSSPTPVTPSALSTAASSEVAVSTVRTPVPMAGALSGQTYRDPTLPCAGPPAHFATVSMAEGEISHLGLTSGRSQHCFLAFNQDGSLRLSGTVVFKAANGDELHGTYTGNMYGYSPAPGTHFTASGTMTVTGGTGRFEDASGQGNFAVDVVAAATPVWPIKMRFDASIVY